jgi:hypothetical protein
MVCWSVACIIGTWCSCLDFCGLPFCRIFSAWGLDECSGTRVSVSNSFFLCVFEVRRITFFCINGRATR